MGELKKETEYHSERYEKLLRQSQYDIASLKKENDEKLRQLIDGFKRDMTTVDREVNQQRSQMTQQNNELKARLEKSIKDSIELR